MIWKNEAAKENALRSIANRWEQIVSNLKEINHLDYFLPKNGGRVNGRKS